MRKSISVVPQDCVLFHNTIRHNIGYGDLSLGQEEVETAAHMAELHNSITDWPQGYDTQVTILISDWLVIDNTHL